MTSANWICAPILVLLQWDSILKARALSTCQKSSDIDLHNNKAFMSYTKDHGVENAFDRNTTTIITTYFDWYMKAIPPQYLDNGFNWVMVELDKEKFQMVDSVTLIVKRVFFEVKRIQDIEVLISNKIDYTPTMYTATAAGKISWNNFVTCGTTGSASGDVTVDCSQNIVNSNYVAVRRDKESTGTTQDGYCCFDFAEFQVNLAAQLDQPRTSTHSWTENSANSITSNSNTDCLLPNSLRLEWTQTLFNGSKVILSGTSTTLNIQNVSRTNSGTYYYTAFSASGASIFQSSNTEKVYVTYKSVIRTENHFYENNATKLTCSSTGGYPFPTRMSARFRSIFNNTAQFKNDSNYGKEAESSLQITVNRSMNFQNLSCNLQQPNFPDTTTPVPIIVYYGAGSLIVSNTSTQLFEGDIFTINCSTSDSGYPPPSISITIGNESLTTVNSRSVDSYRGESVSAKLSVVVKMEWNDEKVTCNLQQEGFPIQSSSVTLKIIHSAGTLMLSTTNTRLYEGEIFGINCSTSDSGFPAPMISITIVDDKKNASIERIPDKYGGESVVAKIFATATKELHNKEVTCTLQQTGFPVQSKSLTLHIIDSPLKCNTTCVALSITVAVLVIVLIGGAVWMIKYVRQMKSKSDAQEEGTERRRMEYVNGGKKNDASNNPVDILKYKNVNKPIGFDAPQMINKNIGITEDLYDEPNDVLNLTDICTNDGYITMTGANN